MITKAEIQSVDYSSNTCSVRIPLFENAGDSTKAICTAHILIPPGIFNGYKANDVVAVAFENNKMEYPVVIGKLFLGTEIENENTNRGAIAADSLKVFNNVTLPANTRIAIETQNDKSEPVVISYQTMQDLLNRISSLEAEVNAMKLKLEEEE